MLPGATIEAAKVAQTLSGLMARRYYATSDKNDSIIGALSEAAQELNLSVNSGQLDPATVDALRAAERGGIDIMNSSGREVWQATLIYEIPRGDK